VATTNSARERRHQPRRCCRVHPVPAPPAGPPPGHALSVEERGFSFDRRGHTPTAEAGPPSMGTSAKAVSLSYRPMMAASPTMLGAHQAFVVAVQALCVAWVLSGLRQRIVQVQVGAVHGVGLGDPVLHAWTGQDVVCYRGGIGFPISTMGPTASTAPLWPGSVISTASAFTWMEARDCSRRWRPECTVVALRLSKPLIPASDRLANTPRS
jgi:hypothetical protein